MFTKRGIMSPYHMGGGHPTVTYSSTLKSLHNKQLFSLYTAGPTKMNILLIPLNTSDTVPYKLFKNLIGKT